MKFTKSDLIQLDNVIRILGRGQYTLEGVEIIAMSDCMKWTSKFQAAMREEIILEEQAEKLKEQKKAEKQSKKLEPEEKK